MTYTIEDVKRLVPEADLHNIVNLIVIVCGEKPGSRIEADLAYAILDTRRQLEIAREALEVFRDNRLHISPVVERELDAVRKVASEALDTIKKEGEA